MPYRRSPDPVWMTFAEASALFGKSRPGLTPHCGATPISRGPSHSPRAIPSFGRRCSPTRNGGSPARGADVAISWRDVLPVHPAADLFPMMSPEDLRALGEDIKANGLKHP